MMAAVLTAIGSFNAQSYCAILCGVMLAFVLERPRSYAILATLTRVPVVVPLAFVAAAFVMLRYTEQLTVIAVVATYLVAYCILQPAAVLRVLTWQPLVYLGQRSYGAYLLHFLAIRIGYLIFGNDTAIGGLLTACFCLAVTVPAAELMYRAIEKPGVDLGRRLISGMGSPAVR
jgi:peptidoglycan/LPS O-acetylase OafA/YrhL